jgi:radical SAM protein with 4Fe4S-binding SPASM domain
MNAVEYGNIRDHSLKDLLSHPERKKFEKRSGILAAGECMGCRFWDICRGGCPMDSYATHNDFTGKPVFCEATKIFLERYFEPVTGLKRDFYQN